jgi:archaemetzincin
MRMRPSMPISTRMPLVAMAVLFLLACSSSATDPEEKWVLPAPFAKLLPLHTKLGRPQPGDWLAEHRERGQSYRQYVQSNPVRAEQGRRTIYIQPLGEFTDDEKKIVDLSAELMGIYYQLPVKFRNKLSLELVPARARRKSSAEAAEQILTGYVLNDLKGRIPKDGVALIAFTTADLWPGEGWNYVFGQANLSDRVGVWSIHRFGSPEDGDAAFRRCLLRAIKLGTHETGHMFSMQHCTRYQCNMCGSNSLPESDRQPLELCPYCLAKLCYATGADPKKRFEKLIEFYNRHGLKREREFCEKSLERLRK